MIMEPRYYRVMKDVEVSVPGQAGARLYVGDSIVMQSIAGGVQRVGGGTVWKHIINCSPELLGDLLADGVVVEVPKGIQRQETFLRHQLMMIRESREDWKKQVAELEARIDEWRERASKRRFWQGRPDGQAWFALMELSEIWPKIEKHYWAEAYIQNQIDGLFEMTESERESFAFKGFLVERIKNISVQQLIDEACATQFI